MTPLGWPVEPDEYWRKASWLGVMSGSVYGIAVAGIESVAIHRMPSDRRKAVLAIV
jgi:hypothetical protein